jgi:hypothetical protein
MAQTWQEIRAVRYSTMTPPPEWPSNVRPISMEGVSLLGIDPQRTSSIGTASRLSYVTAL